MLSRSGFKPQAELGQVGPFPMASSCDADLVDITF